MKVTRFHATENGESRFHEIEVPINQPRPESSGPAIQSVKRLAFAERTVRSASPGSRPVVASRACATDRGGAFGSCGSRHER